MRKKLVRIDESAKDFQDVASTLRDVANDLENEKYSEDSRLRAIGTIMPLIGRMRAGISTNGGVDKKVDESNQRFGKLGKGEIMNFISYNKSNVEKFLKETDKSLKQIKLGEWNDIELEAGFFTKKPGKYSLFLEENKDDESKYNIIVKENFDESAEEQDTTTIKVENKINLSKLIQACKDAGIEVINKNIDENSIELSEDSVRELKKNSDIELVDDEELKTKEVPNDADLEIRLDTEIFGNYLKEKFFILKGLNRYVEKQNAVAVEVGFENYCKKAKESLEELYDELVELVQDDEVEREAKISEIKNYIIKKAGFDIVCKIYE